MKWLVAVALACAAVVGGAAQTPAVATLPTVTSVTLPVLPQIYQTAKVAASVKVLVTTDGRQATGVREIQGVPLLPVTIIDAAVRAWQFAPHAPQSFELTVRGEPSSAPDVCRNRNWQVSVRLPTEVVIGYPSDCCILESTEAVPGTWTVTHVRGVVRDEKNATPVTEADASLYLRDVLYRSAKADARGRFDPGPIPPDQYSLHLRGPGYGPRSYAVDVRSNVYALEPHVFELGKYPNYTPPPPVVEAGELALYPLDLRNGGVSGDVRLQVTAGGQLSVIDGPKELAGAALTNLQTWRWLTLPKQGLTVTYHYRLLPGDCTGDNGPFVTARYPFDVEIAMKRPVPCGLF